MRADLHTHSTRSDGMLAPAELMRQAQLAGLDCLALTDHDSVAGVEEARLAAAELGLQLLAGVELSVRDRDGRDEHLLGFLVDTAAPPLLAYLEQLQATRRTMAEQTLETLERLGAPVSRERVAELAEGAVVTRPHIARALVEAGHVASEQEAFDRYLGAGRLAAPERSSPEPATAIATVRAAGGVAALAHPVFCQEPSWPERLPSLPGRLDRLRDAGLQAIECFYPDALPAVSEQLAAWARERGLIATGGTDYHGPGKAPFAPLGQVVVDAQVVDAIRSAAGR